MKINLVSMIILLCINVVFSQVASDELHCYINDNTEALNKASLSATVTGTTNIAFFLCVEKGQNDSVRTDQLINELKVRIPDYFDKATNNNYHVNVTDILVKSKNNQSGFSHLFILPDTVVAFPPVDTSFVVRPWMVKNVFAQADSIYDFNNFDADNNGIVDYVVFMVIRYAKGWSTGTAGLSIDNFYVTNDTLANGNHIKIDGTGYLTTSGKAAIIQRKRTTSSDKIIGITVHEMGHSLFSFPDMDHSAYSTYDHYALGQFSPMSDSRGFGGIASLYNPYFRVNKGWVVPTNINYTNNISFEDFDQSGIIYEYDLPNYAHTLPNQKIYLTYFDKSGNNRWQNNWPLPSNGFSEKGVMIMRKVGNSSYGNSQKLPIKIISAHGQWLWDRSQAVLDSNNIAYTHAINLGIPDPLKGLDSLQVRYSYVGFTWNSSIHWWETTPVYPDARIGSSSCFYDPFQGKILSFYSNPNCNSKLDNLVEKYSPSILADFKMKNLHIDNNITKADIIVGSDANIIFSNSTLAVGKWYINKNVTVASGVTLSIQEGTTLTFENNSSLIVYGTLNVNGTSSNKVNFNFQTPYNDNNGGYNGIDIKQGGTATINYAEIKNAQYGIKAEKTAITVENSDIHDCVIGTYLYWTNDYGFSEIHSNNLHNNTCCGLYVYHSEAKARDNQIKNNGNRGVFAGNHSTLYLGEAGYAGENNISNNTTVGIFSDYGSYMFLGRETCTLQGGNNIVNNSSKNARAAGYGSVIQAENTWWGSNYQSTITSKFTIGSGSHIYYIPWLSSEPSGVLSKSVNNTPEEAVYNARFTTAESNNAESDISKGKQYNYDHKWPIYWKLLYARNLIFVEDYKFAREICREVIDENPDSSLSFWALNLLGVASYQDDPEGFKEYLQKKTSTKEKKKLYGSMELILDGYETTKSSKVQSIENTTKKYEGTYIEEVGLLQKFMYYLNEENDGKTARSISDELDKKYPGSTSAFEAHRLLGDKVDDREEIKGEIAKENKEENKESIPDKYELLGNFPNPFNPSTTIKYALPYNSEVELSIYDMNGKEVKTFVINSQSKGYGNVVWDGTNNNGVNVASGVYIYKFKAVSLEGKGEVFEKSAKLMLLK